MPTLPWLSEAARRTQNWLLEHAGLRVQRARRRVKRPDEDRRYEYQRRHIDFDLEPGARVLDIGSGGDPFPHATVLVDRYPGTTHHRHAPFVRDGREFVEADVCDLPFPDQSFDFVYCAHVLEHVDDPIAACREIMRVGRRGFIETPTLAKDVLFAWNVPGMHKWHVVGIADHLCFFELTPRQQEGLGSPVWQELILGRWEHPLQSAFFDHADLFNVFFLWQDEFRVHVFRLDGSVAVHQPAQRQPQPCAAGAAR
jgi:SAM-dependent methyltransferase